MAMRTLVGLSMLVLAAACSEPEAAEPVAEPAATEVTTVQATAFLTENVAPPEGAVTEEDGVSRDADGRPFEYALLGKPLPAFTAPMSDGGTFNSADLNRWTVIDIWGVWCGDCVADGPYVAALERAIAQDPDLDFVSIHVPASAARTSPEEMFKKYGSLEAYFASAGYSFPVVMDLDASVRDALEISWTPSYLLVSPDRIVRGFRTDLSVVEDQPIKSFIKDIARVRGEVRDATRLTISPKGVASLTGPTPFTLPAVEAAFPGFDVIPVTDPATGVATFEVRPEGSETARFLVASDWSRGQVATVTSREEGVRGPAGEVIGEGKLGALPAEARALCEADGSGLLVCPDIEAPTAFQRVYSLGSGPEEEALLVELRFLAPQP